MKYLDTNVDSADGTLVKYKWGTVYRMDSCVQEWR